MRKSIDEKNEQWLKIKKEIVDVSAGGYMYTKNKQQKCDTEKLNYEKLSVSVINYAV